MSEAPAAAAPSPAVAEGDTPLSGPGAGGSSSSSSSAAYYASSSIVTVAACNLNQWALDFTGNLERTLQSCLEAKRLGASYRLGPELELCGYGCEDHYFESDTYVHCWESLAELFERGGTDGLLVDVGMPVLHGGARYNCRVLCKDRRVLLIRPKTSMADGGNYRESRYFTAYRRPAGVGHNGRETHLLPSRLFSKFGGSLSAPFGLLSLSLADGSTIGCESCEELWTPLSTHISLSLSGVEIIGNGSGSHHELRKLSTRLELMVSATRKCGGVYLYSNQRGCDGGRLYYDGCAMIVCNGRVLSRASQFSTADVEVVAATVDLEDVRSYRAAIPSFGIQASDRAGERGEGYVKCSDVELTYDAEAVDEGKGGRPPLSGADGSGGDDGEGPTLLTLHSPEEECCLGPACWLWDFLRRSGAAGFFLPLSGGADSSSVCAIVGAMCTMVTKAARSDPTGQVAADCRRVCNKLDDNEMDGGRWVPATPQEMANCVLHTAFLGSKNSSFATKDRARRLGEAVGSYHLNVPIDLMVDAVLKVFSVTTGKTPQFGSNGGTISEDLALQNIQARLRMVTSYLFAQLLPWVRGRRGFLLVLGSANVDEGLRGYMTKYDCSSADLNPIGAISKGDLKRMLRYMAKTYEGYDVLDEIAGAPPTAELRPITAEEEGGEHTQTDEEDMGMTYEELGFYGRLRKISRCGPVSMFKKLSVTWTHLSPREVADKVKRFFYYYAANRHKMCTVTPAYHAEAYSPDDNRFDLRQFLYNTRWTRQFAVIDKMVNESEGAEEDIAKKDE